MLLLYIIQIKVKLSIKDSWITHVLPRVLHLTSTTTCTVSAYNYALGWGPETLHTLFGSHQPKTKAGFLSSLQYCFRNATLNVFLASRHTEAPALAPHYCGICLVLITLQIAGLEQLGLPYPIPVPFSVPSRYQLIAGFMPRFTLSASSAEQTHCFVSLSAPLVGVTPLYSIWRDAFPQASFRALLLCTTHQRHIVISM